MSPFPTDNDPQVRLPAANSILRLITTVVVSGFSLEGSGSGRIKPTNYRSRKQNRIFQHFGRLFLPGKLKNVPYCLNELLVNFREESSGIWPILQARIPKYVQLAQFRTKNRNWEKFTKQAAFYRNWASWASVGIRACKIGQSH